MFCFIDILGLRRRCFFIVIFLVFFICCYFCAFIYINSGAIDNDLVGFDEDSHCDAFNDKGFLFIDLISFLKDSQKNKKCEFTNITVEKNSSDKNLLKVSIE